MKHSLPKEKEYILNNSLSISDNNDTNNNNNNQPNSEDDEVIMLIMSFGDGQDEQLKIYDKQNPEKDIYDFCVDKHFDYFVLEEIKHQVDSYLKEHYDVQQLNNNDKNFSTINNNTKLRIRLNPTKQRKNKQSKESAGLFPYELSKSSHDISKDFKGFKERKHSAANTARGNYINISRPLSNSSTRKLPFNGKKLSSCKHSKQHINLKPNQSYSHTNNNINNIINNKNHIIDTDIIHELNPSSLIETQIIKTSPNKYYISIPSNRNTSIPNTNPKLKNKQKHQTQHHNVFQNTKNKKEVNKHKIEQLKEELNKSNKEIYTFCPKINKISKSARIARLVKGRACTNSSRILNYNKYLQDKQEMFKHKHGNYGKAQENLNNCVFHPKINSHSKYIDDLQNKGSSRFDRLYNYSTVLKQNLEYLKTEEDEKYSYQPHLNEKINNKINTSFQERLKLYLEYIQEKKNKIKKEMNSKNGLFKPNINKNKHYNKLQKSSENIFEKLYADKNINKRIHTDNSQQQKEPKLNQEKNKKILKNKRIKIFQQIFNILDSDGDNQINARTINFNALPKNIQTILYPIYNELKEDDETLTSNEFIEVCEVIYHNLPLHSKKEFMNINTSSKPENEHTYIHKLKKLNTLTFSYEQYSPNNFVFGLFYNHLIKKLNKDENSTNSSYRGNNNIEEDEYNNSEVRLEVDDVFDDVVQHDNIITGIR